LSKAKYEKMSLDELFTELCSIRVEQHALFRSGAPTSETNKWIRRGNEVGLEIRTRGEAARPYYLRLLESKHAELRIVGAMNARDYAPELAVPVLEELKSGIYGGTVGMNAGMTLNDMRDRGEIPPKP
jgi:hypothetical protein